MTPDDKIVKTNLFYAPLEKSIARHKWTIADICDLNSASERRILAEYGAVFLPAQPVEIPPTCMFATSEAVDRFQENLFITRQKIGGVEIELQEKAMTALLAARAEALQNKLDITPRGGVTAARRGYDDTLEFWASRVNNGCDHWRKKRKLSVVQAEKIKAMPVREQIAAVLELEKKAIFFSTYFDKSILYSVAAPGCSQHLSLLAFDINEFADARVRRILARHGWFRTVQQDAPHFTFVGFTESELPAQGLKKLVTRDGEFWIPNVE